MVDRKYIRMFIPVMIEQSLMTLTTMLGTMLVSGVGDYAVSGVGLVDSINGFILFVFNALATGVTVVVSQYVGSRNPDAAGRVAGHSLIVSAEVAAMAGLLLWMFGRPLLGALFGEAEEEVMHAAQTYMTASALTLPLQAVYAMTAGIMRGTGNTRTPMLCSLLANVAYVTIAYLLIERFDLGVLGVCFGLTASRLTASGTALYVLMRGGGGIHPPRMTLRPDWKALAPVLRIALPVGGDAAMFQGGKIVVQVFLSGMGTAVLAANAISLSLCGFLVVPGNSMAIVGMTIVGQSFGAGAYPQTRRHMIRLTLAGIVMQSAVCAALYPALGRLIALYDPSPETAALARIIMTMAMLAYSLIWPLAFIPPGGLRAVGDASFTMVVSTVSMFVMRVAGAWLLGIFLGWGLQGVWIAMYMDWVVRSAIFIPRVLSGVWRHDHRIDA